MLFCWILPESWSLVLGSDYQMFFVHTPAWMIGMERQPGFSGDVEGFCGCVHWWLRIKWSGGKRTVRTWSNYNHQKIQLPARYLQEVLLLCQVLLLGNGGVWLLPCSPALSASPSAGHVYSHSAGFICRLPSSAPLCLQSLPEFPSKFGGFFNFLPWLNNLISLKKCQCT